MFMTRTKFKKTFEYCHCDVRIVIQSVILLDYSLVMYLPAKCNYGLTLGDVNKQTPNLDIIFDKFPT